MGEAIPLSVREDGLLQLSPDEGINAAKREIIATIYEFYLILSVAKYLSPQLTAALLSYIEDVTKTFPICLSMFLSSLFPLVDRWWRRWESNPRPKKPSTESIHAFSGSFCLIIDT